MIPIHQANNYDRLTDGSPMLARLAAAQGRLRKPSMRSPNPLFQTIHLPIYLGAALLGLWLEGNGIELAILYGVHSEASYFLYALVIISAVGIPVVVFKSRCNSGRALNCTEHKDCQYYHNLALGYYYLYLFLHLVILLLTLANAYIFIRGFSGPQEIMVRVVAQYGAAACLHFAIGPMLAGMAYRLRAWYEKNRDLNPETRSLSVATPFVLSFSTEVGLTPWSSGDVALTVVGDGEYQLCGPRPLPSGDLRAISRRQPTMAATNAVWKAGVQLQAKQF